MALAAMRRHKRWLYAFLWIVIAGFILFYVPQFQGTLGGAAGSPGEILATVGGLPITVGEYQKAYQRQMQVYQRLYQGRLDSNMLRRLGLERQVFQALVDDRLITLQARQLGLTVSDDALARSIATSPQFQENGHFMGAAEIQRRLDLSGVSAADFESSLRQQMLHDSLEGLVTDALTVTDKDVEREFRRRTEQVKAEYVLADAARYRPQITVSDEDVKARFEKQREHYKLPEKRVLSYVMLDPESLRPRVTVTDGELESYYREHSDEFKQEAQVCASHILVKVKASPEAKEGHADAEAKAMAEKLLAEVRGGGDFAALARKSSEDTGSAANGGDLGCFPHGRMVPAFDEAVFAMEPGTISDLVQTNFGYHIIKLLSAKEEGTLPFAQVKERVRQMVTGEKVEALAGQKAESLSRLLARGRKLEEAAKEEGLTVQKSAAFTRGEPPPPLTSPTLATRAFEMKVGDVEKEGFPLPRGAAFIALAEIQAAHLPELKEVQERVKADLLDEAAMEKARAAGTDVKTRAATVGLEKAATAAGLLRKETPSLVGRDQPLGDLGSSAALDEVAYSLPEKTLSDPVRVPAGYAVLRILEKKAFDPAELQKQRAQIASSLRDQQKNELFQAYMGQARDRYPVEGRGEAYKRIMIPAR
jgi:peptidyl-prolyl cis-trans isomerase D